MSIEPEKREHLVHHISLQAREALEVKGVTDVISFDDQSVVLDTVCGNMAVEGNSLHIRVLNVEQGIVSMDGRIDSINYYETESTKDGKRGLFGRLLK